MRFNIKCLQLPTFWKKTSHAVPKETKLLGHPRTFLNEEQVLFGKSVLDTLFTFLRTDLGIILSMLADNLTCMASLFSLAFFNTPSISPTARPIWLGHNVHERWGLPYIYV